MVEQSAGTARRARPAGRVVASAAVAVATLALAACGSSATGTSADAATPAATVTSVASSTAPSPSAPSPTVPTGCRLTTPRPGAGTAIYDWVDFVVVGSTRYFASTVYGSKWQVERTPASAIGPTVATVTCRYEDIPNDYAPPKRASGDAAFLEPGTEVHAADGYDVSCRVVVRNGSGTRAYLAADPTARTATPKKCALRPIG